MSFIFSCRSTGEIHVTLHVPSTRKMGRSFRMALSPSCHFHHARPVRCYWQAVSCLKDILPLRYWVEHTFPWSTNDSTQHQCWWAGILHPLTNKLIKSIIAIFSVILYNIHFFLFNLSGFKKFIALEDLLAKNFVKDDILYIEVTVDNDTECWRVLRPQTA